MADLYGTNESEDMSSFLQILLQNSSSAATTSTPAGGPFCGGGSSALVAESSSTINFSDPSNFFAKKSDGISSSARLGNFGSSFETGAEDSDIRVKPAPLRFSKRSRAADIHNLSEKRRRSRINEKLKALQNLVPNSSKTDKASMLDEAIEYLKQLQLQVQMLTMRNGLNSHPGYSPGSLVPQSGVAFDEGNILLDTSRQADTFSQEQEMFRQTAFDTSHHASSTQPTVIPSMITNSNSKILAGFMPPAQNNYGLLNHLPSSKNLQDICRDGTLSRVQLDTSFLGTIHHQACLHNE